jgi:hypothetical protein
LLLYDFHTFLGCWIIVLMRSLVSH